MSLQQKPQLKLAVNVRVMCLIRRVCRWAAVLSHLRQWISSVTKDPGAHHLYSVGVARLVASDSADSRWHSWYDTVWGKKSYCLFLWLYLRRKDLSPEASREVSTAGSSVRMEWQARSRVSDQHDLSVLPLKWTGSWRINPDVDHIFVEWLQFAKCFMCLPNNISMR